MQYTSDSVVYNTWKNLTRRSKQHKNRVSNIQMNCSQLWLFTVFLFSSLFV